MAADTYVTNVVQANHSNDTDILYGAVRNVAKEVRDVINGNFEAHPASGSLDDYDISAGVASGGLWSGSFPVEVGNGFYIYQIRLRAGATPDFADEILGAIKGYWNGAIFAEVKLDANGRVDVGSWLGVAPLALASQYVQTDAKKVNGATPMSAADVNAEADTALTDYDPPTRAEATSDKNEILAGIGGLPTPSGIADEVCDELLAGHTTAGSLGKKISDIPTGLGAVAVDHNFGGADALRYVDGGGSGIDNADIWIYLKSDYDAGNVSSNYVKAKTNTDVNGRWANPVNLDPAVYTVYVYKQGEYGPDTQEITVT